MNRQQRIERNFREAAKLRRKREAAEREQMEHAAAMVPGLMREVESLKRSAFVALPADMLEVVVDKAAHDAAVLMARHFYEQMREEPWMGAIKDAAYAIWKGSLPMTIWRSNDPTVLMMLTQDYTDEPGYRATFTVPEIKWTQFLDSFRMENFGGPKVSPIMMEDRLIYELPDAPTPPYKGSGEVTLSDDVKVVAF